MRGSLSDWFKAHVPHWDIKMLEPVISIGKAASITGLSESALRKYETAGLIVFRRTDTNRRIVSFEDIDRIRIIKDLIKNKGLNINGILRLWALMPCWELKQCIEKDRESCPATSNSEKPCWVLFRHRGCAIIPDCASCEIYRYTAYCTEDIKQLYYDTSNFGI